MSDDIVFFGILGAILLVVVTWLLLRMPRGSVVEAVVQPDVPFELRCSPPDSKKHRLCLHYALTVPGRDPELFGIACEINAEIGGEQVVNEVIGVGYRARAARPITKEAHSRFAGSKTRLADSCKVSETAVLIGLGPRSRGSEIVARGLISTPDDIGVESMSISITR